MEVTVRRSQLATPACGMLAVGVSEGAARLSGAALALDKATKGAVTRALAAGDFQGRLAESLLLYPSGVKAKRVLLVGLGRADQSTEQRVLLAAAQAAKRAREAGVGSLVLALHTAATLDTVTAAAAAEGAVLGHYRHLAYRSEGAKPALERVELTHDAPAARTLTRAVERGRQRGEAVCLARDLANTPGQDLTPEGLAERAAEVAKLAGAKLQVFDVAAMERLGMGCVLAVGRGSVHPPRFIVLDKPPAGRRARKPHTLVVIGKGVTFDTGGYSLKPRDNMGKMKYDMSGAAAVLGLFASLPAFEALPVRLVGLIPSAENMVSDRAFKPGDVVRALDGTTIEVTNTDAEGRLLLADALGYARRFDAEAVIDLATLTGAMAIALGRHAAGLYTRDDLLAAELEDAGDDVGERLWRMPLWDEFLAEMRGDTADLVNSDMKPEGGSNKAAAFLMHFAGDMRWAHLDIASTAWTYGERPDAARGANAFGVRLLVRWLERRIAG